jgi:hypothetical protein
VGQCAGGVSEVSEVEVRKVEMKEVRVKAGTVRAARADQVRAESIDKIRADRAIEVRGTFKFHHGQAQLKYLEALEMFDDQETASSRFVVVIIVVYVY